MKFLSKFKHFHWRKYVWKCRLRNRLHICVSKLTITGSDNGLSPGRRQAIIWTNAGILLIRPLGINFSEIFNEIQTFSLKKIRLKMLSAKCCSFCLGFNVLRFPFIVCFHYPANYEVNFEVKCQLEHKPDMGSSSKYYISNLQWSFTHRPVNNFNWATDNM